LIDSLIWLLIYLTLFLAPLILFPPLTSSIILPKYFFITSTSFFLFFLLFLKWLFEKAPFNVYLPFLLLLFFIFSWTLLNSSFSLHPFTAFFGNPQRYDGWLAFFSYLVFPLTFLFLRPSRQKIVHLLKILSLSGALVSLIGLAQAAGWGIKRFSLDPARLSSTLGNPDFLASFLLLTIFPTLYLIFSFREPERIFLKSLFFSSLVLQLSALYLTYSRGAWAAFLFFLLIFLLFLFKRAEREKTFRFLTLFFFAFFLSLPLNYFSHLQFLKKEAKTQEAAGVAGDAELLEKVPGLLPGRARERITSAPSDFQRRLDFYQTALKAISYAPFLGSGLDSYHLLLGRMKLGFSGKSGKLLVADRPHNDFLQTAVMLGLPGFLFYFAFLTYLCLKTLTFLFREREKENSFLALTLFLALFSYLFYLQFVFHTPPTAFYFYSLASLLVLLVGKEARETLTLEVPAFLPFTFKLLLSGLTFLLFLFFFYRFSFTPIYASYLSEKAVRLVSEGFYSQAIKEGEKAVSLMPQRSDFLILLGESYRKLGLQTGDFSQLEMGLYFFRRAVEVNPYLRFNHLKLAVSLLQAGEATGNKAYVEEAIPTFKKVIQFSPDYFEAYYNLGVAYYYLKDFRKARFYFEKTLSLNKEEKDAWFLLGKVAEKEGKPKEALKFYERSLKVWEKEKRQKSKGEASWELEEKAKEAVFQLKKEI